MLTQEHVEILSKPFAVEDYDWLDGNAYIREDKIVERLNTVDPSWEWVIDRVWREGNQVNAQGRLIVCGITRSGTGTQTVQLKHVYRKDASGKNVKTDEIVMEGSYPVEVGEAEKGATTDAFKRTARLFMIGGHILQFKRLGIVDEKSLRAWLKSQGQQRKAIHTEDSVRRIPAETEQAQPERAIETMTIAELGEEKTRAWLDVQMNAYQLSSQDVLRALGVQRLGAWDKTLGAAENAIKAYSDLHNAHQQNQQHITDADTLLTTPIDHYYVNEIKNGKNAGKHYISIANVAFFDGDGGLLRDVGFNTDLMRGESLGKHELGTAVQVAYVEEIGSGGKTNKKPVKVILA